MLTLLKILWRNLECKYLVRVANNRQESLQLLLDCVGYEFADVEPTITSVGFHTQSGPGYCTDGDVRTSEICWEAPVCITVYVEEKPLIGMAVEFRGPTLCIRQLQGAPGARIPESLRKWPALFVKAGKNFLFNTAGISSLRIYSADQRPSYDYPFPSLSKEEMVTHQQHLRRRYDGTARQQGFKKMNAKYWAWDLSMLPTVTVS
jgi:hypothetical protein